ncbi:hypothetical protein ATE84_1407 [Aquimarina sp. MAR_2010_214]|uniref:hypothetical protein n=1 Tax=Aquimarina sp. MAR_2010_214 TaxID=1250026 RepID=UPI000C712BB4|nr:hypothetical protein [Aquimarina sp. MAR_2010_214]PKV49385.1 hypothetical protein ATE84_1407 [Aquimarina sp. MAR_2010_214]
MNTICNNCKSNKIVTGVRITDLGEVNVKNDLSLEIYKNPDALFFKGTTRYKLKAKVCCSCGTVETYIDNPEELWRTYQNNKNS